MFSLILFDFVSNSMVHNILSIKDSSYSGYEIYSKGEL